MKLPGKRGGRGGMKEEISEERECVRNRSVVEGKGEAERKGGKGVGRREVKRKRSARRVCWTEEMKLALKRDGIGGIKGQRSEERECK